MYPARNFRSASLRHHLDLCSRRAANASSLKKIAGKESTGKAAVSKTSTSKTAAGKKTTRITAKVAELWTEYEKLAMIQAQSNGQDVYHVVVKIDPHCAMPIAGRQLVHNAIGVMGPVLAVRPDAKSPAASKEVEFVLASTQTAEQIAAKCRIPTIAGEVTVDVMLEAAAAASTPQSGSTVPVETSAADITSPEAIAG